MSEDAQPSGPTDRQELIITVVFLFTGLVFLGIALYSAGGQWTEVQAALAATTDTPPSRVILEELNREILAIFIGSVLFASGVFRWRE